MYKNRSFRVKIFVLFLVFFASFCDKPDTKVSAVVLFSVGDVTSNGKKLKVGDIVLAEQHLQTAAKSICDLQLMGVSSEITVRVQENSKFQVKQRENKKTTLSKILYGTALFNVQKLGSSDNFLIETHVSTAGVRGTKLEVSVAKDNSTKVSTLEGKVSTRFRFASLEESEKLKASKTAKTFVEASESNEQFIEAKQSITTTKKEVDTLLTNTGLSPLLEKPDAPELSKEIDAKLSVSNVKENFQKQKEQQAIRTLSDAEVKAKLTECNELVAIDLSKLSNKESMDVALKERNTVMKDVLQRRSSDVINNKKKSCLNVPNFLKCMLDL